MAALVVPGGRSRTRMRTVGGGGATSVLLSTTLVPLTVRPVSANLRVAAAARAAT